MSETTRLPMRRATCRGLPILMATAALIAAGQQAAAADEPFAGKTVTLLIPFASGSGYDTYGRALARHIGRFIPGAPTVVPSNMIGGGGLVLSNHLYNIAPKDGTTIGLLGRSNLLDPLFGNPVARFDPRKFSWVGNMSDEVSICASWHESGFKTWQDLTKRQFNAASSGIAADNGVYPLLLNRMLDTKFKVVAGYKGGPAMNKAMEDKEVDGRCGWSWSAIKTTKPTWISEKKINLLLQAGLRKSKELPDVPLILDLAKNQEDRRALELAFTPQDIAWGVAGPPDVPADRLAILRKAFHAALSDKTFLAEAQRLKLDIDPRPAEETAKTVERMYQAPKPLVEKVRAIMLPGSK